MNNSYKNISGIYKIWFDGASLNPDSNPVLYIGLTKNLLNRKSSHLYGLKNNKHRNSYLQNAFNRHGESSYRFEVVEVCDYSIISEREIFWINFYKTNIRKYGYNLEQGGFKPNHSIETREKIRKANIGKSPSLETRQKLRQHNLGKKQSPETIEKVRAKNKGRKLWSDIDRLAISERMKGNANGKGRVVSEETKLKISKANKGKKSGLSKKRSEESILKGKITRALNGTTLPKWTEERKQQAKDKKFKHTEETKQKIGQASKRFWKEGILKPPSEETREKIRKANTGKKANEETKQKMSVSLKKVIHTEEWNKKVANSLTGRKLSSEHIENIKLRKLKDKSPDQIIENVRKNEIRRQQIINKNSLQIQNDA